MAQVLKQLLDIKLAGERDPHCVATVGICATVTAKATATQTSLSPMALDHAHDNEVALAYDRDERFTQRVQLFNWWGEQLAAAQRRARIIALPGRRSIYSRLQLVETFPKIGKIGVQHPAEFLVAEGRPLEPYHHSGPGEH